MKKIIMKKIIRTALTSTAMSALVVSIGASMGCGDPPKAKPTKKDDDKPVVVDVKNRAFVFPQDPISNPEPEEILLEAPNTDDGTLTNDFVHSLNCLQKDGGSVVFGFATTCVEESSVVPDEDGSYRSVLPPDSFTDGQDPFAQVQMYHHVNVIHDFYKNTFAFDGLDFPLDAVVNITINIQGQWQAFENAAFIPEAGFAQIGLPARPNGAIMFGQGAAVDYAYDASVIYHEYTHAMIGPNRMNSVGAKAHGLDNTAGAMNEGLADYFASSVLDDPFLGHYALGVENGRDLESSRKCPDDLTTEVHADGKIISTALWEVRGAIGKEAADEIVFNAVQNAVGTTGLDEFGELVNAEAVSAGKGAEVTPILEAHGLLGCERAKPWVAVDFAQSAERVPHQVEGKQGAQGGFDDGVPGYHQFFVDVPAGKSVALNWGLAPPQGFGGGANGPLNLAVKQGSTVEVDFNGGIVADTIVADAPLANNAQAVTLTGDCVPAGGGRVYLLFLNNNNGGEAVQSMGISFVDAPADGAVVATCN